MAYTDITTQMVRSPPHKDIHYLIVLLTGYTVVCYTTNWGQYRSAPYTFTTDHIEASLCTHIIHSFIQITNGVLDFYESNDESKCCIVIFFVNPFSAAWPYL